MQIYKRRRNGHNWRWRFGKAYETSLKVGLILLFATPFSALATGIWYLFFYRYQLNVGAKFEVISTAAWVPWLAVVAGLINGAILTTVIGEYKEMRAANKTYDIETFMRLRDEDVSPLLYTLMSVFDLAIVGGFMLINYADVWHGVLFVWTSSYMVTLLFFVIRELDDPLAGVWFIKNIHQEWLDIPLKEWRAKYYEDRRKSCILYFNLGPVPAEEPAAEPEKPT